MAHRGEKENGMHYRGFKRLRPGQATAKEVTKEPSIDELEAIVKRMQSGSEPKPPPKPTPKASPISTESKPASKDPYAGLSKDEIAEMKRRERVLKITGGR